MYNPSFSTCDWPRNVDCGFGHPPAPTVSSTTRTFTTATDSPVEDENPPVSTGATPSTAAPASTRESAGIKIKSRSIGLALKLINVAFAGDK